MNILGISQAYTCPSGVRYELETLHTIADEDYIITWGYSSHAWHKFRGIRKVTSGYRSYETRNQVEIRFRTKKKKSDYMYYLDRIINQISSATELDQALSLLTASDLSLYTNLEPVIRKIIKNPKNFTKQKKKKMIQHRKYYIKQNFGSVNGLILLKMLN